MQIISRGGYRISHRGVSGSVRGGPTGITGGFRRYKGPYGVTRILRSSIINYYLGVQTIFIYRKLTERSAVLHRYDFKLLVCWDERNLSKFQ